MRYPALLATLIIAACGSSDVRARGAAGAPASPSSTADQLALRVPRAGGTARVMAWPRGDSALWRSPSPVPALRTVLAFDDEDGALLAMDTLGHPVRIELRAGRVVTEKAQLAQGRSADGWATFGVSGRSVRRLTPTGESWTAAFPESPAAIVPTPDGAVIIVVERADGAHVYRARPPAPRLADSAVVAGSTFGAATPLGDRLFLVTVDALVGLRGRDLKAGPPIPMGGAPRSMVASPSGDRVFVLVGDATAITVVDRYRDAVERSVALPGAASGLRMDPLGRWLIVRAASGNAIWLLALGTMTLASATTSTWRDDLPAIAPDGTIVRIDGADVVRWDGTAGAALATYVGGAADSWHLFSWNGFRAQTRVAEPMEFAASSADSAQDSLRAPEPGAAEERPTRQAGEAATASAPVAAPPAARGFLLSFAALLGRASADSVATAITIEGDHARVVTTQAEGTPVFRVVLGPYPSREQATRIGKLSRRDYWVLEVAP